MTDKKIVYRIIRSRRKTLALGVDADGVTVRAPFFARKADIDRFVEAHREWINERAGRIRRKQELAAEAGTLSEAEIKELAKKAAAVIPERAAFYAAQIGVTYGRITIRSQRTRWGSCSSKGNLNFNCLLMLAPPEVLDSVVVHELCHRKEMNHSQKFYKEVLRVFPDYKKWHKWLRDNGDVLLARLPEK